MRHVFRTYRTVIAGGLLAAAITACDRATDVQIKSPIQGLTPIEASDSSGNTVPHNDTATAGGGSGGSDTAGSGGVPKGPGSFHGTVLGQWDAVPGQDSIHGAPRLAGVTVVVYPRVPGSVDPTAVGPAAATMSTDAKGEFQSPTLPGGDYLVTFTPPSSSIYRGVYATFTLGPNSSVYPWWVVLPKK